MLATRTNFRLELLTGLILIAQEAAGLRSTLHHEGEARSQVLCSTLRTFAQDQVSAVAVVNYLRLWCRLMAIQACRGDVLRLFANGIVHRRIGQANDCGGLQ